MPLAGVLLALVAIECIALCVAVLLLGGVLGACVGRGYAWLCAINGDV